MIFFLSLVSLISLIFLGLLGISLIVMIHEFGHFLFAKLFNVLVPSFSIGFGPRILEKKIGETTFALSAIPLGGYVELAGSQELGQGEQLQANLQDDRSFASKPYWQKFLIMIGGILFNIIFAYATLSFLLYLGAPGIGTWVNNYPAVIGTIVPGFSAEKAKLQPGDTIIALDHQPVNTIGDFQKLIKSKADTTITLTIDRKQTKQDITVDIGSQVVNKKQKPRLGVHWQIPRLPFIAALKEGFNATLNVITKTFKVLVPIFPKDAHEETGEIGGPLALIAQMVEAASYGTKVFFLFLALVSIGLAVLNILPLPIFDGGQLLTYTIEALTGRPLSEATRYKIHYFSWFLILALLVVLTSRDIARLTGLDEYISKAYSYLFSK